MLDGPMRPKLVEQPVRRKSSIFRKIRDKLRRGSLISSSTAASMGIAGMLLQTHSGTGTDLADMLFKSAA